MFKKTIRFAKLISLFEVSSFVTDSFVILTRTSLRSVISPSALMKNCWPSLREARNYSQSCFSLRLGWNSLHLAPLLRPSTVTFWQHLNWMQPSIPLRFRLDFTRQVDQCGLEYDKQGISYSGLEHVMRYVIIAEHVFGSKSASWYGSITLERRLAKR